MVAYNTSEQSSSLEEKLKMILFTAVVLIFISGSILLFESFFEIDLFWLLLFRLFFILMLLVAAVTENVYRYRFHPLLLEFASIPPEAPPTDVVMPHSGDHHRSGFLDYCGQHLLIPGMLSLTALWCAVANICATGTVIAADTFSIPALVVLLIGCFVLLVTERFCSVRSLDWIYQPEIIGLCRIHLSLWLLAVVALLSLPVLLSVSVFLLRLASMAAAVVACEFLIRLAFTVTDANRQSNRTDFSTRSLLAIFYRWPLRPGALLLEKTEQHLGINLSGLQTFQFMKRLGWPVCIVMVIVGWLSGCIINIPIQQRGIYERMGQPVAVFRPGVYLGLPWPFGSVRLIEYGMVHELQTSTDNDTPADSETTRLTETTQVPSSSHFSSSGTSTSVNDTADGLAPLSTWRLWDTSHIGDQSQIIASQNGNQQEFQIMDMDVRLIWRIGLTDQAALASTYRIEKLPVLIRNIASQVLVRAFAGKQLDSLLSGPQNQLAAQLNRQIQHQLDVLDTGVELLSTKIESIHPPAGAANAYHGVQAAQIDANALISKEHGYAASLIGEGEMTALTALSQAQASSVETIDQSRAEAIQFAADTGSWHSAGQAFLLERHLQTLQSSLGHSPLLILDSHLQGEQAPLLDFRRAPFTNPDNAGLSKVKNR